MKKNRRVSLSEVAETPQDKDLVLRYIQHLTVQNIKKRRQLSIDKKEP